MLSTPATTPLTLKQYSKDVPPGWRPRAYPIREYRKALDIWARLTRLEQGQLGAAVMSRLEGKALQAAEDLIVIRPDDQGNAVQLPGH